MNRENREIPMLDLYAEYLYMKDEIDLAIKRCLEHQKWILGPEVGEFEKKLAQYLGVKHCIGVSSGTDALLLALRALAIKTKGEEFWDRKDLIITTPFTFTATGDTILRAGATPLFVDIDPETYNINPKNIKKAIEKYGKRVVGIIPVHLYGLPCNMDEIMEIARNYNLFVIEDTAQAFGSMWNGKKAGTIGDAGAFSFFPSKNLGAFGDAGAVATNDDEIAELVRILRVHGGRDKYNVDYIGYKARLDTLQAAILLVKLKYTDEFNERRRSIARIYNENLRTSFLRCPIYSDKRAYHVYHQYTVYVSNGKRDLLQRYLKDRGIQTMVYYPVPLHKMKVFEKRCEILEDLRYSEESAKSVLSLPIGPLMEEDKVMTVIEAINSFSENCI